MPQHQSGTALNIALQETKRIDTGLEVWCRNILISIPGDSFMFRVNPDFAVRVLRVLLH